MRLAAFASLATAASALVATLWCNEARAGATLMTGLGGPKGYGTSCMPPNDDGSWPEIDAVTADPTGLDITPAFPKGLHFFTGSYTHTWINNNGNISFNGGLSTYTPNAFPGAPQPMIAPFWADVDTRDATYCGNAGYPDAEGYPAGAMCMNPQTNGVWWSLTPGQMVVTWDSVGYFQCHTTPTMSFQMILTAAGCGADIAPDGGVAGVDFDIEFRYATCGWEAGDASGGTNGFCPAGSVGTSCYPAQAGFDSGETPDKDYWSLPMSLQSGVANELCTGSNLTPAQPGIWRFGVRGGVIHGRRHLEVTLGSRNHHVSKCQLDQTGLDVGGGAAALRVGPLGWHRRTVPEAVPSEAQVRLKGIQAGAERSDVPDAAGTISKRKRSISAAAALQE